MCVEPKVQLVCAVSEVKLDQQDPKVPRDPLAIRVLLELLVLLVPWDFTENEVRWSVCN